MHSQGVEIETVGDGEAVGICSHRPEGDFLAIQSLAVKPKFRGCGWGRLLFFRVVCRAVETGKRGVIVRCFPDHLDSYFRKLGFRLEEGQVWKYSIPTPFLFYCADGGRNQFSQIAADTGWLIGARSDEAKKREPYLSFIDNHYRNYSHPDHLEKVAFHKPLLATALDIESLDNLEAILHQAKQISKWCGRVLLIPKMKFNKSQIDFPYWWGFSVPSSYGGTSVPCGWFGSTPTHLLGGSPKAQSQFARHLNMVSLDGNVAMKMAQKYSKSIWQANSGVKVADGCYAAFQISMREQKLWWERLANFDWRDEPLFLNLK